MSTTNLLVVYGIELNDFSVETLIENVNEHSSFENIFGYDIRVDEPIYDLKYPEYKQLLEDLCADNILYSANGNPIAYFGHYLGELNSGDLLEQLELFQSQIKNIEDPYKNNVLKRFLPEPKLILIKQYN